MEFRSAFPTAVSLGVLLGVSLASAGPERAKEALSAASLQPERLVPAPVSWDLPVVWNESVSRFVTLFHEKQSDRMALYLKRGGRYEGMIRGKLRERGMPEDLVYLSMIESGFNPNARSRASAVGLWQFMGGTARDYGLRVDGYVDERRDPEKSTDAALRYLQDLYKQFGSWSLAAAAYNTGGGRVARIMREETGAEKGQDADFWRIRARLPRETREYVPLIFAAAVVGKQPEKYGLQRVQRWLPILTDTVEAPGGTSLKVVAKAVAVEEEALRQLNPHLVQGVTPPGKKAYPVRIPDGRASQFALNFELVEREAKIAAAAEAKARPKAKPAASKGKRHKVRRGDSLWTIARRYDVSVGALQRANGLGRRSVLQPGQSIRIPG